MKRFLASSVIGLAALTLNPMIACQSEEEFTFGEAEMRNAATGSYSGTVQSTGDTLELTLEQGVSNAPISAQGYRRVQCGSRSFVQPAAACATSTTMEIEAHITSSHPSILARDLEGTFEIYGFDLDHGSLSLLDGDIELRASFNVNEGGFVNWTFNRAGESLELRMSALVE